MKRFASSLAILLVIALMFTACTKKAATPGQTPESRYRTLVKVGDDIAHSVELGLDLTAQLYAQKVLEADLTASLATGFLDAARISKELHTQLTNYKTLDQGDARTVLMETLRRLSDSVNRLALNGTLHIRNQQTKTQLDAALSVINTGLVLAKGLVGGVS